MKLIFILLITFLIVNEHVINCVNLSKLSEMRRRKHRRNRLANKLRKSLSKYDFSQEAFRIQGSIGIPLEWNNPLDLPGDIIDLKGLKALMDPAQVTAEDEKKSVVELYKDKMDDYADRFKIAAGISVQGLSTIYDKVKTWASDENAARASAGQALVDTQWGNFMYYPDYKRIKSAVTKYKATTLEGFKNMAIKVGKKVLALVLTKIALAALKYAVCTAIPIPGLTLVCAIYDWIKEAVKYSVKVLREAGTKDYLAGATIDYSKNPMIRVSYADDLAKGTLGVFPAEEALLQYKIDVDFQGKWFTQFMDSDLVKKAIEMYGEIKTEFLQKAKEAGNAVVTTVKKTVAAVKSGIASASKAIKDFFGWRFKKNFKAMNLKKFKVNSKSKLQQKLQSGFSMIEFFAHDDLEVQGMAKQMFQEQLQKKHRRYV